MPPDSTSQPRFARLVSAACFLGPLAAYLSTAARTVQGGDASEFACLGLLGGVAHPPGYPLYTLLARIAGALPWGDPFLRVSAVSALCGAACVAVVQRAAWRFSGSLGGSVAAAAVFALAPLQWRLSGLPEVFSLNALAAALLLLLALRLRQSRAPRDVFLVGLAGGLGLTNHLTLIWCAPILIWAIWDRAALPRNIGLLVAGGVVGLLPYALLPLFARTAPVEASVWGEPGTFSGFLQHVLRRDYGTFRLAPTDDTSVFHLDPIASFMESLPSELAYVPFAFGLVGLVRARRIPGTGALLFAFGLSGIFFISLFNLNMTRFVSLAIEERFHLLPMVLLVPFLAVGMGWLLDRLPVAAQAGAIGVLSVALFAMHHEAADWKRETVTEDFVKGALQGLEPNAVLVGSADTWYSATRWVTRVKQIRPDVRYVDVNIAHIPWYADRLERDIPNFPRAAVEKLPWKLVLFLASTGHPTYVLNWDALDRAKITTEPEGFVDRVVKPGGPASPLSRQEELLTRATEAIQPFRGPPVDVHSAMVRRLAALHWQDLAVRYQQAGDAQGEARCRARVVALYPE